MYKTPPGGGGGSIASSRSKNAAKYAFVSITRKNMHTIWKEKKTDYKMYGYLPWYYYFVSVIINIIKNLNILDIDVFSPAGNQYQVSIYFFSYNTQEQTKKSN